MTQPVTLPGLKDPSQLLTLLTSMQRDVALAARRITELEAALRSPRALTDADLRTIRRSLSAGSPLALNITQLLGIASQSQRGFAVVASSLAALPSPALFEVGTLGLADNGTSISIYYVKEGAPRFWAGPSAFAPAGLAITSGQISSTSQFYCYAFNSASQSINDVTLTALTFDSEDNDRGALHSTSSNTSRLTVPTGGAGVWLFVAQVSFAANATGVRYIEIAGNGSIILAKSEVQAVTVGSQLTSVTCAAMRVLADADYVEARVYQSSGGALNAVATSNGTFLVGYKLC